MEVNQTAPVTEQSSTVAAPDWTLLNDLSNNQDVAIESTKVESTEQKSNTDVIEDDKVKEEIKVEEKQEEKKEEKVEDKPENKEVIQPEFEIKVTDLKNVTEAYEDGDWRGVAKELGGELKENSFDEFKQNFVHRSKLDEAAKQSKEQVLATLKPENAAALEMLELGLPEDLIFNPTKELDAALANMDDALKLTDTELYRRVLENTEGYTAEDIDTEIEELVANGKIAHKARIERINIHNDKKTLSENRVQILETKKNLIQKHTADKQRIALQQKEQDTAQFIKALNDKSDFMGVNIPKEVKDVIALNFRGGVYDNELNVAQSRVDFVLQKELGPKFADLIKKSAYAKGKESEVIKNSNIPIKQSDAGGQKVIEKKQDQNKDNQFQTIVEDFRD